MRTLSLLLLTLVAACNFGFEAPPPPTLPPPSTPPARCGTAIGSEGGTVNQHGVVIEIPAGALSEPIDFCAAESTDAQDELPPPADAVEAGPLFQLGPHGTQFAAPVKVRLPFDPSKVAADREVVLFHGVDGGWVELPGQHVTGSTVEALTSSFSPFRPFARLVRPALPLTIVSQPADKTVLEGVTAAFAVVATGRNLTYQWERAPYGSTVFASLPGETAATLSLTATLADREVHFRVRVSSGAQTLTSAEAKLSVVAAGAGSSVFVQSINGVVTGPAVATHSGAGYTGSSDLGAGTFAATSLPTNNGNGSYAGVLRLSLFNNTGAAMTIPAGAFRLHVEGTYTHTVQPDGYSNGNCTGVFAVDVGATAYVARGDHTATITYDSSGATKYTTDTFTKAYEQNGASVSLTSHSLGNLEMDLVMPQLVVPAGESMGITVSLLTTAFAATADFSTSPAALSLTLPRGLTLDHDAPVPLRWIVAAP